MGEKISGAGTGITVLGGMNSYTPSLDYQSRNLSEAVRLEKLCLSLCSEERTLVPTASLLLRAAA